MFNLINVLYILSFITYPFERIATFSSNIICKIFNIKENDKEKLTEYNRITIGSDDQMRIFIDTLKNVLEELKWELLQ